MALLAAAEMSYARLAFVVLLACAAHAMVTDCMEETRADGTTAPMPDGLHCGTGENLLHDLVCLAGKCVDRVRVQHMRWMSYGRLEYVVCRQRGEASTAGDLLLAEVSCARNVDVRSGGAKSSGAFSRTFELELGEGQCWTAPKDAIALEAPDAASHELVVCQGVVRPARGEAEDVYRTAFSYEHPSYMRYY